MASTSEGASHDNDDSTGTPGTPGSPGSNDLDVPEEFYYFRDLICPHLFRENVPRNTSILQGEGWIAEIMSTPHAGRFYDNVRMTKLCFCALVDALSSRGLLPQGQTARDCIGAIDGILEPAWAPQVYQNRYRSRKDRIAQNVLAICDFNMNFTYVYAGWEGSAADARVLDHAISQDSTFLSPQSVSIILLMSDSRIINVSSRRIGVLVGDATLLRHQVEIVIACCTLHNFIRRFSQDDQLFNELEDETTGDMDAFYHRGRPNVAEIEAQLTRLTSNLICSDDIRRVFDQGGFPQEEHWNLEMERRFMWMILDANAAVPMSDDSVAEGQMAYWSRAMRRLGGYPYTQEQIRAKFYEFKDRYRTFHAPTQEPGVDYDFEYIRYEQIYPIARSYLIYPELLYPSMLEVWGRTRAGRDFEEEHTPLQHDDNRSAGPSSRPGDLGSLIIISDSITPLTQTHTHVDMGSGTGGIGTWTDYIRRFGPDQAVEDARLVRGIAPLVHAHGGLRDPDEMTGFSGTLVWWILF
ncbi:UNVERIFIED_CONTAM: hypothetical protein Slati_4266600 [Sesamum latifolium]|uniref:DDE Tnp4 domain-containing protein n=1 Tax=Sesamum latifolium TaxID=2727402 RepID=A0AAW2TDL2_9LAMI